MKKFTIFILMILVSSGLLFMNNSIAQTTEFFDDFEGGADAWELTGDWGLTEGYSYSDTHSMTDSPEENYPASQETYCTMMDGVDLSDPAILSAEVSFWAIYDIEGGNFDYVYVEASDDDFVTFVTVATFLGEGNLDPWMEYKYSLGAFIGSDNVKVRFHLSTDGGYEVDGFYYDDFSIVSKDFDDSPPYIGYDTPPEFYEGSLGAFDAVCTILDVSGISSTEVAYSVDGGDFLTIPGTNVGGDEYNFQIPTQDPGAMVHFSIAANDASPAQNETVIGPFMYIAGEYIHYDDPEVAFYSNIFTDEGTAVVFTLEDPTQLVTGLIRNYEASNLPPNREFEFHVWDDAGGIPGVDMIPPFMVQPAATNDDNSPMTVVDLRGFAAELSNLQGDYFIGFIVPDDTVKITMAALAAGRSFSFSGGAWGAAAYDFHFRAVTSGAGGTGPAAFFDDFEDGLGNWDLTGQWGLTETQSYSPTNSLTDSPDGNYPPSVETYASMTTGVDLSDPAILSADLSFWAIYDIEGGNFDFVYVEASDDDFATFITVATFLGEGNMEPWMQYTYPLGSFLGSDNVKVRFHFSSDGGYEVDGFYVDDFEISTKDYDDAPPFIAYPDPPTFYQGTLGDYDIVTTITDISGIASAEVIYSIDGGADMTLPGVNTSGDEYIFTIPEQESGALVDFFLKATDASPASNVGETDGYAYVAGEYIYYDDPEVAFYSNTFANEGVTVQFTFGEETQLVTALIRNYEDGSTPPNKDFEFHVWDDAGGIPGADVITPFTVSPAANLEDTSPMTLIDLRDYADELSGLMGDYYIGFMVPEDTVKITMAALAAGRSFAFSGGAWGAAAYDFHFRCVTTGSTVGIVELDNNLRIYPNPLTYKSVIELNTDISVENTYLEVYSLMGTKVDVKYTQDNQLIEIFKEGLANGTYIFRVFSNKELIGQGKLVVQ